MDCLGDCLGVFEADPLAVTGGGASNDLSIRPHGGVYVTSASELVSSTELV